ncbi:MAG: DNA-processing protein DprA [Muribaculaceae bacterium]|nr:DNA-processing protein DprA [Muribaculaceae bacterium]
MSSSVSRYSTMVYRMAFANMQGMGVDLARKLLDVVGSEERFFAMTEKDLRSLTRGRSKIYRDDYRRECLERAVKEDTFVREHGITATYFMDEGYPRRLLEAPDAPALIYTLGQCDLESTHVISVVGTRHATQYGIRFCDTLIGELAQRLPDLVVVSGLAYGIDIAAHRAALKHGVPTVAVLPRGLNRIYPSMHRPDAVAIAKHGGMLLTDYTSQDAVQKSNFLARNRIVAALSDCTVIVESAGSGGALVTASLAMSYNRDVMAVPGRCGDEFSAGCNKLIATNKAALITSADDLMAAMRWESASQQPRQLDLFPDLTKEEQAVVDAIRNHGEIHLNALADALGLPVYKLMSTLVELDCKNVIATLPGCRYTVV